MVPAAVAAVPISQGSSCRDSLHAAPGRAAAPRDAGAGAKPARRAVARYGPPRRSRCERRFAMQSIKGCGRWSRHARSAIVAVRSAPHAARAMAPATIVPARGTRRRTSLRGGDAWRRLRLSAIAPVLSCLFPGPCSGCAAPVPSVASLQAGILPHRRPVKYSCYP